MSSVEVRGLPPEAGLDETALDDESAVTQESREAEMDVDEDLSFDSWEDLSFFGFIPPSIEAGRLFLPGPYTRIKTLASAT